MTSFGYAGKILRVDLYSRRSEELSTFDYVGFLGGRGIAAKIYWDEVMPETNAFHPDNRLIFAVGPLCGLPSLGSSRWTVCGKSPTRAGDHFCYSNLGGRWGAELKFAGYDAIVVQGQSEKPVYLFITDSTVELKEASFLWGRGAMETRQILKSQLGSSARVVAIGPAGENMVVMASLLADNDASGSGGLGAVMGSKKLKAIAVESSRKRLRVAQRERLQELTNRFRGLRSGAFLAWGRDYLVRGPRTRRDPCYGCEGNCVRISYQAENGTAGKFMCQSSTFYQPWSQKYYGRQNDVPFYATKLCDDYGLDTWALELMILWMKRCYKAGILTDEKAGIPISQLGSLDFIQTLVRKISLREGLGDMLARGLDKAADFLGSEARREVRHTDPYDPRLYITTALLWATEPREPIQQLHEVGLPIAQWVNWVKKIEGAYLSSEVLRAIARRFWGSEIAADFSSYEGKALAAKQIQDREYAKECLILCDWLWPVMASEYSEGYVGDPSLESAILSAVTGDEVNEEGLYRIGEKVFNLQRAILIREGHRGREDDRIPEEWHTVPLKSNAVNADCVVPGKHGEVVCRKGAVVDRQAFERMKDEYYQLRGWDVVTGFPSCAKLEELELDDVAQYLEQRGW